MSFFGCLVVLGVTGVSVVSSSVLLFFPPINMTCQELVSMRIWKSSYPLVSLGTCQYPLRFHSFFPSNRHDVLSISLHESLGLYCPYVSLCTCLFPHRFHSVPLSYQHDVSGFVLHENLVIQL
jgi:hypothetical protein